MILDPDRYTCPEHQADLTALVTEALEDEGSPVAFRRSLLRSGPTSRPRPFRVIVSCPGAGGTGAHDLTCQGTRAP